MITYLKNFLIKDELAIMSEIVHEGVFFGANNCFPNDESLLDEPIVYTKKPLRSHQLLKGYNTSTRSK